MDKKISIYSLASSYVKSSVKGGPRFVHDLNKELVPLGINVKTITPHSLGEKSGIKYGRLLFTLSWLLFKDFLWRMKEKYSVKDFHPLVFFYFLGGVFGIFTLVLSVRLFYIWWTFGEIPPINALGAMFTFMGMSLFILFAMWFDMSSNQDLK